MNRTHARRRLEIAAGEPEDSAAPAAARLHLLLALDSRTATNLLRQGISGLLEADAGVRSNLHEVVWDTPALTIGHAGFVLASEKQRGSRMRVVLSLKDPIGAGRYLQVERAPFGTLMPVPPPAFPDAAHGLMPIFGNRIERRTWQIEHERASIGVTAGTVTTEATGSFSRTHFLELAHASGDAAALYSLAERLRQAIDFELAALDRFQNGYRLIDPTFPWPCQETRLDGSMMVRAGIAVIAREAVKTIRQTTAAVRADPGENQIHKARVAVRRLRSMLSVFSRVLPPLPRVVLSSELNAFAHRLGALRDADVLLRQTLSPLGRAIGPDPVVDAIAAAARQRRAAAAAALVEYLNGPAFMALQLTLGRWFDADLWRATPEAASTLRAPFGKFARKLLRRRHRRLSAAGEKLDGLGARQLHEVRISAKKQRYAAEFLRSLFDHDVADAYIETLKQLQDVLGTANDASVAIDHLPIGLDADDPRFDAAARAHGAGLITGWSAAEGRRAKRELADVWQEFRHREEFWKRR